MLTSLDFLRTGEPWPPKSERDRLNEYYENMLLRSNDYEKITDYYKFWQDINRNMREDEKTKLSLFIGYFALMTRTETSLLWGSPPIISGADDTETNYLDSLRQATSFKRVNKEVTWDASSLGTGLYKIYRDDDGNPQIQANSPDIWFPVVRKNAIRIVDYHVLANVFEDEPGERYLYAEIHSKTEIVHKLFKLAGSNTLNYIDTSGKSSNHLTIGPEVDLSIMFPGMPEVEPNVFGKFLVVPVHNIRLSNDVYGQSDYDKGLKSLLRGIILRYSQRQRILDKHSDPSIVAPKNTFGTYDPVLKKQVARAGGRLIEYDHDPNTPAPNIYYLTWDASMAAVEREIQDLEMKFAALSGLPPQFFGLEVGGTAESGTALYYKMQNLLARVQDLKEEFDEAVPNVLSTAAIVGGTNVMPSIKWNDGLKQPPLEAAQCASLKASTGLFDGEVGQIELLKSMGYSQTVAESIIRDSSRIPDGV